MPLLLPERAVDLLSCTGKSHTSKHMRREKRTEI